MTLPGCFSSVYHILNSLTAVKRKKNKKIPQKIWFSFKSSKLSNFFVSQLCEFTKSLYDLLKKFQVVLGNV